MNSMTGFGRGSAENELGTMTAELKSVNSRFLEINMRSDHFSAFLEDTASRRIKQALHRGKVTAFLSFQPSAKGNQVKVELDQSLLEAYASALKEARKTEGLRRRKPSVSDLLTLPEPFIHVKKEPLPDDRLAPLLEEAVDNALKELLFMREREGANLKADLTKRTDFLQEKRAFLLSKQDEAARAYEARLKERIDKVLQDRNLSMDEGRVLEEVAIFSEKADYTEEVVRFGSHLVQFRQILDSSEPSGRKLDFLLQEINREVNTTASKASDTLVVDCVIIIKTELEKIREQVQNIE